MRPVLDRAVGSFLPGGFLVLAAALKAWSPRGIEPTWSALGLPYAGASAATITLIFVEALVGLGLILLPRERRWRVAAIGMFAGFTVLLAWILTRVDPPRCGCLGSLGLPVDARAEAAVSLGKTLVLLGMVVWGWQGRSAVGPRAYNSSRWTSPTAALARSSTATS